MALKKQKSVWVNVILAHPKRSPSRSRSKYPISLLSVCDKVCRIENILWQHTTYDITPSCNLSQFSPVLLPQNTRNTFDDQIVGNAIACSHSQQPILTHFAKVFGRRCIWFITRDIVHILSIPPRELLVCSIMQNSCREMPFYLLWGYCTHIQLLWLLMVGYTLDARWKKIPSTLHSNCTMYHPEKLNTKPQVRLQFPTSQLLWPYLCGKISP